MPSNCHTSMSTMYDTIVIGAGPAGAIAASTLADAGIKTLILEKKKVVGVPNHCGEGISHYVLDFLDVDEQREWIVKNMKGSKIYFPNQKFVYYHEKSYCIDRTLFDQELTDSAVRKGAKLLLDRCVVEIERCNNGNLQIITKNGEIFTCRYLIAADGAQSTVRKIFDMRAHFLTAIQYKFDTIEKFEDDYLVFFHREEYHPGYAWIFSRGIETSIGLGGIGNLKGKLEMFLTSLGINAARKKSVQCGVSPHPRSPMKIALPGILFAGDAGGFTFPLTGAGIIGALTSGRVAGEVTRDVLIHKRPQILSTYMQRVRSHPSRSRTKLFYCHKYFLLDNHALNAIGEVVNRRIGSRKPIIKALHFLGKRPTWSTVNGLLTGLAAHQMLRNYKNYVF